MTYPGGHQWDQESTAKNPVFSLRNVVSAMLTQRGDEATEVVTTFPFQGGSTTCVPFMPLITECSPCRLSGIPLLSSTASGRSKRPAPLLSPSAKRLYSIYKRVKNAHATCITLFIPLICGNRNTLLNSAH